MSVWQGRRCCQTRRAALPCAALHAMFPTLQQAAARRNQLRTPKLTAAGEMVLGRGAAVRHRNLKVAASKEWGVAMPRDPGALHRACYRSTQTTCRQGDG